jgi:hypothetical protein
MYQLRCRVHSDDQTSGVLLVFDTQHPAVVRRGNLFLSPRCLFAILILLAI